MIDFRYHLVSLISVFLALAIGIVLGAGPLNQTIGDQLTGQVEELRADRERIRELLEESEAGRESLESFLSDTEPQLLASRLEGRSVSVVSLPEARRDDIDEVRRALELSGATITSEVAITAEWTDPATAAFRESFAGQVVDYLVDDPGSTPTTDTILALALAQSLTDGDADGTPSESAQALLDLLTQVSQPLSDVVQDPDLAATATVVVGPPTWSQIAADPEAEVGEEHAREATSHLQIAQAFARTGEGSVLVGSAHVPEDLLSIARADEQFADTLTTVDGVTSVRAWITVPMALATTIAGSGSHYGYGLDAELGLPEAVYLPPPAPEAPEEETTEPEGDAEDTGTGAETESEEPTDDTDAAGLTPFELAEIGA